MGKGIRYGAAIAALSVFLVSIAAVGNILYHYYRDEKTYQEAEERFTAIAENAAEENRKEDRIESPKEAEKHKQGDERLPEVKGASWEAVSPPLAVDFEALRQVNGDVAGWLYCEGTPISYPVVRGEDNSFYLSHSYDKTESSSGAIFADAACSSDFSDANTILYGHHMKNGSMFACLRNWADQDFYEEHPRMWLFTPEGDYLILLFSGYTTRADSETYTLFTGSGRELESYLAACAEKSDFQADFQPDFQAGGDSRDGSEERYVVLSTCEYSFQDARYVLHGKLVPAGRQESH